MHKLLPTLHEDDLLLILDKPAGLAVIPDRNQSDSVLGFVKRKYPNAAVAHRIDKDTSGIIVLVKDKAQLRSIASQFESRSVTKVYYAIVEGHISQGGTIEAPIIIDTDRPGLMKTAKKGKAATTHFTPIRTIGPYTELQVSIETGRQHQIRVHMKHIGHPLAIDPNYGNREAIFLSEIKGRFYKGNRQDEQALISRQTLHAMSITLHSPALGQQITVSAPIAKDLRALINQLEKMHH